MEQLWAFHANPANVARIAPPRPRVETVDVAPFIGVGDTFTFRLHVGGLPLMWVGRVTAWNPPHAFTDEQVRGPFALFRHTHQVARVPGGAVLIDCVTYSLPGGPLGRLVDAVHGRRAVERIFAFRHRALEALFGASDD